jgi:hypothetical protein
MQKLRAIFQIPAVETTGASGFLKTVPWKPREHLDFSRRCRGNHVSNRNFQIHFRETRNYLDSLE